MKTLNVILVIKKSKTKNDGLVPLNIRIAVDSDRFELSTKIKVLPNQWDSKKQVIKGKSEEIKAQNNYISTLKSNIHKHFNVLQQTKQNFTINDLKYALHGKRNAKTLLEVFEENNSIMEKEADKMFKDSTLVRYQISIERLKEFLKADIAGNGIYIEDLDYAFMKRYDSFLRIKYACSHNTAMKYLKHLKKVINQAVVFGYVKNNLIANYKTAYKETNRGYLTNEELKILKEKVFRLDRLDETRDIFLFTCYTGISYSDLKELSGKNIQININGQKTIVLERLKTGVRSVIPLLSEALEILDKYSQHELCIKNNLLLPVISNQKLNLYLQEIAELCEISSHLTMHLGRHTFATTITLSNGVPVETVQKMLGHKSIQTTMIYGKVVDSKVADDMLHLEDKLDGQRKKNSS